MINGFNLLQIKPIPGYKLPEKNEREMLKEKELRLRFNNNSKKNNENKNS